MRDIKSRKFDFRFLFPLCVLGVIAVWYIKKIDKVDMSVSDILILSALYLFIAFILIVVIYRIFGPDVKTPEEKRRLQALKEVIYAKTYLSEKLYTFLLINQDNFDFINANIDDIGNMPIMEAMTVSQKLLETLQTAKGGEQARMAAAAFSYDNFALAKKAIDGVHEAVEKMLNSPEDMALFNDEEARILRQSNFCWSRELRVDEGNESALETAQAFAEYMKMLRWAILSIKELEKY